MCLLAGGASKGMCDLCSSVCWPVLQYVRGRVQCCSLCDESCPEQQLHRVELCSRHQPSNQGLTAFKHLFDMKNMLLLCILASDVSRAGAYNRSYGHIETEQP